MNPTALLHGSFLWCVCAMSDRELWAGFLPTPLRRRCAAECYKSPYSVGPTSSPPGVFRHQGKAERKCPPSTVNPWRAPLVAQHLLRTGKTVDSHRAPFWWPRAPDVSFTPFSLVACRCETLASFPFVEAGALLERRSGRRPRSQCSRHIISFTSLTVRTPHVVDYDGIGAGNDKEMPRGKIWTRLTRPCATSCGAPTATGPSPRAGTPLRGSASSRLLRQPGWPEVRAARLLRPCEPDTLIWCSKASRR